MTINISFSDKSVRVAVELNGEIESAISELPQRTWAGLTDEEIREILVKFYAYNPRLVSFAQEIQAKLKEKNT
jgi:hypothetical protein